MVQGRGGKALTPGDAAALADDYPAEPGTEGPPLTELRELAIGDQKGFLGGILGQVEIAEQSIGAAVG